MQIFILLGEMLMVIFGIQRPPTDTTITIVFRESLVSRTN
jgi:hypothetical protein